jgi:hypothetical protein
MTAWDALEIHHGGTGVGVQRRYFGDGPKNSGKGSEMVTQCVMFYGDIWCQERCHPIILYRVLHLASIIYRLALVW